MTTLCQLPLWILSIDSLTISASQDTANGEQGNMQQWADILTKMINHEDSQVRSILYTEVVHDFIRFYLEFFLGCFASGFPAWPSPCTASERPHPFDHPLDHHFVGQFDVQIYVARRTSLQSRFSWILWLAVEPSVMTAAIACNTSS